MNQDQRNWAVSELLFLTPEFLSKQTGIDIRIFKILNRQDDNVKTFVINVLIEIVQSTCGIEVIINEFNKHSRR